MTGIAERNITTPGASLTARQRMSLRTHLAGDRAQLSVAVEQLLAEMGEFARARRDSATDDEHDPEGPTLAFERSQSSAVLAQTERHLADIDAALLRMDEGRYGLCTKCGGEIAVGRLQARPQSPLCIACAARLR